MRACQPKDSRRKWRSAWGRERERVSEGEREKELTDMGEKESEKALWLLLLYVFFLHLGLPYANWA